MPTSTLGIILDSTKISQLLGVVNAVLGDFKLYFYLLLGAWIALFIIDRIVGLGVFSNKKRKKHHDILEEEEEDEDEDEEEDEDE